MFASPIFDPTKPPPPLPLVLFPADQLETQRNLDERFVADFLTSRNLRKVSEVNDKSRMSIRDYRTLLSNALANMQELKQLKADLERHKDIHSADQWTELLSRAKHVQDLLQGNLEKLEDPQTALAFRSRLAARRKKRAWQKRRNARQNERKAETLANRKQLDASIKRWQERMQMKVDEEKRLQQELDNAARFLADVHRRKAEAKRNLTRFERLKQLHQNRQEREAGGEMTEKKFVADLREPVRKWTETLAGCVSEERKLKDVLARRSIANRKRRVENQWQKVHFGDAVGLKTTWTDVDRLVEVRRAWDKYLVLDDDPDGSSVPVGWVLPRDVPLHGWMRYRERPELDG